MTANPEPRHRIIFHDANGTVSKRHPDRPYILRLVDGMNKGRHHRRRQKEASAPLIIFDEIHKYKDWKNYLKGVYDQFHEEFKFLASGSGRLDIYQKGGDSLAGRYYLFHLFPFTLAELSGSKRTFADFLKDPLAITMKDSTVREGIWQHLASLSGFPEPFLSGRETTYRRWPNSYARQLVREDIRDLTDIKAVQDIETLYTLLPSKIGSPLSVTSLAENLKVSYNTVRSWMDILERFYLTFCVPTWTGKIARAIQKEKNTTSLIMPASRMMRQNLKTWLLVSYTGR